MAALRLRANERAILHGLSNFNVPLVKPARTNTVLTVHDLIPLIYPTMVSVALRIQMQAYLPLALQRADAIVAVSEWTRQTLNERYPDTAERVTVIPNGFPAASLRSTKRVENAETIKILTIARHEPYKRLPMLLEIIRAAKGRLELTLITDEAGCVFARTHGLTAFRGLSAEAMTKARAAADVYVHPSLVEGFCLPACEALGAGLPVVYVEGSGLDEVVGSQCGLALSRHASPLAWADAIEEAARRAQTPEFSGMIAGHLATRATWDESAGRILELYGMLAG